MSKLRRRIHSLLTTLGGEVFAASQVFNNNNVAVRNDSGSLVLTA